MPSFLDELHDLSSELKVMEREREIEARRKLLSEEQKVKEANEAIEKAKRVKEAEEQAKREEEEKVREALFIASQLEQEVIKNYLIPLKEKLRNEVLNNNFQYKKVPVGLFRKRKVRCVASSINTGIVGKSIHRSTYVDKVEMHDYDAKTYQTLCKLCESEGLICYRNYGTKIFKSQNWDYCDDDGESFSGSIKDYEVIYTVEAEV